MMSTLPDGFGDLPLRCRSLNGTLDMSIGINTLKCAAENHPEFYDGEHERSRLKVTDAEVFASEIECEINREDEDGSTIFTRMLDLAIEMAVQNGCEGVNYDEDH